MGTGLSGGLLLSCRLYGAELHDPAGGARIVWSFFLSRLGTVSSDGKLVKQLDPGGPYAKQLDPGGTVCVVAARHRSSDGQLSLTAAVALDALVVESELRSVECCCRARRADESSFVVVRIARHHHGRKGQERCSPQDLQTLAKDDST